LFELRSKKELKRLHDLSKPPKAAPKTVSLPSIDSHDEDGGDWSDDIHSSMMDSLDEDGGSDEGSELDAEALSSDKEQPYERNARVGAGTWSAKERKEGVSRLPIKLPNGTIVETGERIVQEEESESEEEDNIPAHQEPERRVEDVATGARFGRPAVATIIGTSSRQRRIQMAKEQIAGICQDILADPENSVSLFISDYFLYLFNYSWVYLDGFIASHSHLYPALIRSSRFLMTH